MFWRKRPPNIVTKQEAAEMNTSDLLVGLLKGKIVFARDAQDEKRHSIVVEAKRKATFRVIEGYRK